MVSVELGHDGPPLSELYSVEPDVPGGSLGFWSRIKVYVVSIGSPIE